MQHRGRVPGQRDSGGREELAGLVLGEAQLRGADLGQVTGQPQLVQPQRQVARTPTGRRVSSTVSCPAASGELSSCRSSMTRTKRSQDSSSSDSTLFTMALPLVPGVTGGSCAPPSPVPAVARTAPSTVSQKSCMSCWPGRTVTKATGQSRPGWSAHARNSDVLPVPAGAEMIVTRFWAARFKVAIRS
jgi:hypothetical protein